MRPEHTGGKEEALGAGLDPDALPTSSSSSPPSSSSTRTDTKDHSNHNNNGGDDDGAHLQLVAADVVRRDGGRAAVAAAGLDSVLPGPAQPPAPAHHLPRRRGRQRCVPRAQSCVVDGGQGEWHEQLECTENKDVITVIIIMVMVMVILVCGPHGTRPDTHTVAS
jgi:hypothetical protein